MAREAEAALPAPGYLSRPGAGVTPFMRSVVTSWQSEVVAEFGLQQETLFLGVALADRFQGLSPAVRRRGGLRGAAVKRRAVALGGGDGRPGWEQAGAAAGRRRPSTRVSPPCPTPLRRPIPPGRPPQRAAAAGGHRPHGRSQAGRGAAAGPAAGPRPA
jgi:hypothetical protein